VNHISVGALGENEAADYLTKAGYCILQRNYRTKSGEIDIIARKNGIIIFVEVKTRRSINYGLPSEAVTYHKRKKIIKTALCYLNQTQQNYCSCRFDIVEILLLPQGIAQYNHIVNAFSE